MLKRILIANILFFAFTNMQAQPKFNYTAAWKKADELINKKGLTESALKEVATIYTNAKKEKNDAQLIKALVFRINIQQQKEEEADVKAIFQLEKELLALNDPAKSIVASLLAEAYWQYFQNNRWKFYNRTNTDATFKKDDITTWTADDLHKRISSLYLASIKEEKLLQQTKLDAFEPIIIKGNMRQLRPTLYDLLAHRALDYFENDERTVTKPEDAFEISSVSAFSSAAAFVKAKFPTNDSAALHHKALLLFQNLIAFHLNDKTPDALVDVDIRRIQFVNRYSTLNNKTDEYRNALQQLWKNYNQQPFSTQAAYLLAQGFADFASTYDFKKHKTDDALNPRFYYKKAVELCKEVMSQKTESEGKINCSNLLAQIEQKDIAMSLEKVNVPGKPFRSWVRFKNTSQIWFRILKVTREPTDEERENYREETYWTKLAAQQPTERFTYKLPATDDYQLHSTELKMPALAPGMYMVLVSANENFTTSKNIMAVQIIYVSNIAWLHSFNDFFVLNRETGKPLPKATVQVWQQGYDYNKNKYVNNKAEAYATDANGYFKLKTADVNNNFNKRLEVIFEKDRLFTDDNIYSYRWDDHKEALDEIKSRRVFLFTDRSIYRPGQTVFFKGIVTTTDAATGKPKIVSGLKTKIVLYDANAQKADSTDVVTNEFGSYSGKFTLPQGGLNGNFRITDQTVNGETNFSVEEYKRPGFFVEYQPIKETFKVNDAIKLTGTAKAYAGNNIDNAKVKYRVVRKPRLLYPWLCWRWGWPPTESKEIAHGEATTKADGSFEIVFAAQPDKQVRKELLPVFDYKVIADVTDLNGETRTGETTISAGYTSLKIDVSMPQGELVNANEFNTVNVSTQNIMGEYVKTNITVSIYKLNAPNRLIRERYWEQPDLFVMNEKDYLTDFPNDEYSNETEKESWQRLEKVFERSDTSSVNSKFQITNSKWSNGWYVVEAVAKDKEGNEVKNQSYVQVTDGTTISPAYVWNLPASVTAEPGANATLELGSSAGDVFLIQQEWKNNQSLISYLSLNNEKKKLSWPVTENNRGGFGYSYAFVKHNRVFSFTKQVNVPWTNKELSISFETFRDKTLPGSNEEWKIKITGYKGEKVAAELLASAYDASLDQFKPHQWSKPGLFTNNFTANNWSGGGFAKVDLWKRDWSERDFASFDKRYDLLLTNVFGYFEGAPTHSKITRGRLADAQMAMATASIQKEALNEVVVVGYGTRKKKDLSGAVDGEKFTSGDFNKNTAEQSQQNDPIQIRKNFSETAFFFPQLQTDADGNVILKFTMPEALTKWKTQLLAHTKDVATGIAQKEIITQKELMVQPFAPRFLREGDRFEFTAKITNLTDKEISGSSNLQFFNATTMQPVDAWFQNMSPNQFFTVAAGQSTVVKFRTEVPYNFNEAVTYRIIAKADNKSDGEEMTLPVLTNRMLVTESLPLNMRGEGTRNFSFTKLINNNSQTLQHHKFTIEFTSNPVWYAVQALPYMMEYPYECAEQTWNRFYANALATHIVAKMPKIKAVFEQWKTKDTAALLSNLQKNEELKAVLLEETPWVLQAKNEEQQKKNIALLFDMIRMSKEMNKALQQLQQMQSSNGGFVWFKGGPDDRYITQYIVTGIGHLKQLSAWPPQQEKMLNDIVAKAIPYLDKKLKEDYDYLIRYKVKRSNNNISYSQIQYLYMRSFFKNIIQTKGTEVAYNYYLGQGKTYWLQQSRYMQAMLALVLNRNNDVKTAAAIVKSLKENALMNEEMGMYWKEFNGGYYWYQAPVEAQALMIEVFHEVAKDETAVNDLKTWLLKQKQTQNWKTTVATAEACYALLLQGTNLLAQETVVEVKAGSQIFSSATEVTEAGTGYFKRSIDGSLVKPEMGNIQVTLSKKNQVPLKGDLGGWGAAYWQYFENLDKITSAETPLKLQKKYFVERNTNKGPVLTPVEEGDELKVGDKLKVRIELRVDRNMEYVHMKDMRASCMEPVNVISTYKWQDGLGYYESTKDASTNFFFNWLPKGTYVFEYPMFITHAGNYSAGVTTIQCMYAPEFTSHSEGVRVKVKE
ncbi:MAG: alpha-2-macroglobulin [Chitinophagaceae bacterium]|nr:alpha-2-macroglobulin [Chitinophagaceae bacterium]